MLTTQRKPRFRGTTKNPLADKLKAKQAKLTSAAQLKKVSAKKTIKLISETI